MTNYCKRYNLSNIVNYKAIKINSHNIIFFLVHFRHKEVIIYPDDNRKPPEGEGLNRKAQVTLDRVWPHDKSSHEPITDPKRLIEIDYEGKLRRVSAKHNTRFLEYRPETGSWVFKVDHFSKYGLSDSDDEENGIMNKELNKNNENHTEVDEIVQGQKINNIKYVDYYSSAADTSIMDSYNFTYTSIDGKYILF